MSKFLRVDFEIQPWGCARVDGIDMIASLSVHEVRSLSGGIGDVVAVSHVWGDAQCVVENVQGASHGIKISSPKKMERLLNIAKSKGWENLWLDNICINQEDNDEKAREVMRMGSVYRETRATLILLESTRSELLGETIPRILLFQEETNVAIFDEMENNGELELLVGKFIELAQDEWYERLWTVQETALATSIYMAAIDEDTPYDVSGLRYCDAFWRSLTLFAYTDFAFRGTVDSYHYLFWNFCNRWICSLQTEFTMEDALQVTRHVKCSVAKDRVYGILGLIPNSKIIPSYGDTSLEEVAVTVMKDCVNNLQEMDLLYYQPKLEEIGKCMVPSWESLIARNALGIVGKVVHDGNCMYDENVGLRVSNPRIFEAKIVGVIELDRSVFIGDGNLRFRALFKALKEKLHDDQLVELIRGAMVVNRYPQCREDSMAWEYFKIWDDIVSFPSHMKVWDVLQEKYGWTQVACATFEHLWRPIDHTYRQRTYILGVSKDNSCPYPCCKRTFISTFSSDELLEDNLIVMDYGGHFSDDGELEYTRVPVMVLEPKQEGVKFISAMVMEEGIRHESKTFEIDAITIV